MALAGVTSQVFMGVRISCLNAMTIPFDVWTQENFYGFAAYFGKTQANRKSIHSHDLRERE